jgi:hypothetical protein
MPPCRRLTFPGASDASLGEENTRSDPPTSEQAMPSPVPDEYLVTGRLEGNFPRGTADLGWRFIVAGDRVVHLQIAP